MRKESRAQARTLVLRQAPIVRVGDKIRKCVLFFGYADSTPGKGGIECIGTGFLLEYQGIIYLVTAKHLSHTLGQDPFYVRANKHDGTSENLVADDVFWIEHPDPTVDVSVVPFDLPNPLVYDILYLGGEMFLPKLGDMERLNIGVGNFIYTMGLFRLLSGEKRNLPICHVGTIAMLPGDERIPVVDWTDPDEKRRITVEGYLVESQSLDGLSGSPVFVRPEVKLDFSNVLRPVGDNRAPDIKPIVSGPMDEIRLLGLWQGAWDAKPDDVLAASVGDDVRVPVGMGIVVPWTRIIEVLEMPECKQQRQQELVARQTPAARPQRVRRAPIQGSASALAEDANPNHLQDFTRLVDVAARKRQQDDQT